MNKILFVGDLNTYSRSYHIYQALSEIYDIRPLSYAPIGEIPGVTKRVRFLNYLMTKLGYRLDSTNVNERILNSINCDGCPDLVFINQGLSIRPSTIRKMKEICPDIFILYLTLDNMLIRRNRSNSLLKYLPLVDIYIAPPRNNHAEELKKIGVDNYLVFPTSYNPHEFVPRNGNLSFERDVVFIGTYEDKRFRSLRHLALNGIEVTVFGNGWPRNVLVDKLKIQYRPVYQEELTQILHTSRIALNFVRKMNHDLITDRTVEIPATGTFMLSERTEEQLNYFVEGEEAEFFDNDDELLNKVIFYLSHPEIRMQIAASGRRRCEASGYSYREHLESILDKHVFGEKNG